LERVRYLTMGRLAQSPVELWEEKNEQTEMGSLRSGDQVQKRQRAEDRPIIREGLRGEKVEGGKGEMDLKVYVRPSATYTRRWRDQWNRIGGRKGEKMFNWTTYVSRDLL